MKKTLLIFTILVGCFSVVYADNSYSLENEKKSQKISNDYFDGVITHYIDKNRNLQLIITMKNIYSKRKGGISVSFPQFLGTDRIKKIAQVGFEKIESFKAKSPIWNRVDRKAMKSKYLLIEGWDKSWKENEKKTLRFTIDIEDKDIIVVNIRGLLKKGKKELYYPTNGEVDQQKYFARVLVLDTRVDNADNKKSDSSWGTEQYPNSNNIDVPETCLYKSY